MHGVEPGEKSSSPGSSDARRCWRSSPNGRRAWSAWRSAAVRITRARPHVEKAGGDRDRRGATFTSSIGPPTSAKTWSVLTRWNGTTFRRSELRPTLPPPENPQDFWLRKPRMLIKIGPRPKPAHLYGGHTTTQAHPCREYGRCLPHHCLAFQFLQELPRFVDLISSFPNYDVKALIQRFHDTGVRTGK